MTATVSNRDLDAAGILRRCVDAVPVNVRVDPAIEAHRQAFAVFTEHPTDEAESLSAFTLRAVILARTPTVDDARTALDYLTALPRGAWSAVADHTVAEVREMTLDAIARCIVQQSGHK